MSHPDSTDVGDRNLCIRRSDLVGPFCIVNTLVVVTTENKQNCDFQKGLRGVAQIPEYGPGGAAAGKAPK